MSSEKIENDVDSKVPVAPVENTGPLVLVTGGTGYIASHIIYKLLDQGYKVRTTARNATDKKTEYLKTFHPKGATVEVRSAVLTESAGWDEIVGGCEYILHTASPFTTSFKDEQDLIVPAVEGTLNVLRACAKHKESIKKIIVTSSVASVMNGHSKERYAEGPFSEKDFSVEKNTHGYELSKLKAEQAAWEFARAENLDMCTVLPGLVVGPFFADHHKNCESSNVIRTMLMAPLVPAICVPLTHVGDVANVHIAAMLKGVKGERYLSVSKNGADGSLEKLCHMINSEMGDQGHKAPTKLAPYWILKIGSLFNGMAKLICSLYGAYIVVDNTKTPKELGIEWQDVSDGVREHIVSLIKFGARKPAKTPAERYTEQKIY